MSDPYENCTKVTPDCPVSETTYGYAPNLGGNAIYAVIFAVCAVVQLFFIFKHWRLWKGFSILVCIGCIGEAGGYVARIFLHNNPWSGGPMSIQFVLLMVSPSFLAAALYMTLRALVQFFGPEHTRLAERFWTWPFVTADTIGFLMQCGGGIMASMADINPTLATAGVALMITGVTLQAVVMGIAGVLAVDFALRYRRRRGRGAFRMLTGNLALFLLSMSFAFVLILARCIYRIPELAGGVGGTLMRQEVEFMIFDGLMIVVSCAIFSVLHPGHWARDTRTTARVAAKSSDNEAGYEMPRRTRYMRAADASRSASMDSERDTGHYHPEDHRRGTGRSLHGHRRDRLEQ